MSRIRLCLTLLVLLLGVLACNTPFGGDQITPSATTFYPTTTPPLATSQPLTDSTGSPPTQSGQSLPPRIHSVGFTTDPDLGMSGSAFRQGVTEIWAVMDYFGMREGLTFKRVWYLDGEVWIEKEEPWDFAKYGAEGKIKDISIYDRDAGLPVGKFELEIKIDDTYQLTSGGQVRHSFEIVPTATGTTVYKSPSGAKSVLLEHPGTLRFACELCDDDPLAVHDEIVSVYWFPDEQHVLYVEVDRGSQFVGGPSFMDRRTLWIVNIDGSPPVRFSADNETFYHPTISPDGSVIAVQDGSGFCDGGDCDSGLLFIQLEGDQRTGEIDAGEFAGPLFGNGDVLYPFGGPNYEGIGEWVSAVEFVSPIQFVGVVGPEYNAGMYRFNLTTLTATRIADLPPQ